MDPSLTQITDLLEASATHHHKICPRQVLGVRIGLLAGLLLDLPLPQPDKRLIAIAETDGCFVDGISAATGCYVGRRTLRIEDYGKIAATFIDIKTEETIRINPKLDLRQRALIHAPNESRRYFAQLQAYQTMPTDELLDIQPVRLRTSIQQIISRAGVRVNCDHCGEEVINEREIAINGQALCRACASGGYYQQEEFQLPLCLPHQAFSY